LNAINEALLRLYTRKKLMNINIPVLEEFSFIHGVVSDSPLLAKMKEQILIETYPLKTTGLCSQCNLIYFDT
jgi:hypothetical protein